MGVREGDKLEVVRFPGHAIQDLTKLIPDLGTSDECSADVLDVRV